MGLWSAPSSVRPPGCPSAREAANVRGSPKIPSRFRKTRESYDPVLAMSTRKKGDVTVQIRRFQRFVTIRSRGAARLDPHGVKRPPDEYQRGAQEQRGEDPGDSRPLICGQLDRQLDRQQPEERRELDD